MALSAQGALNAMYDSFVAGIVAAADLTSTQQLGDLFTWRTHRHLIDPVVRRPFIDDEKCNVAVHMEIRTAILANVHYANRAIIHLGYDFSLDRQSLFLHFRKWLLRSL